MSLLFYEGVVTKLLKLAQCYLCSIIKMVINLRQHVFNESLKS